MTNRRPQFAQVLQWLPIWAVIAVIAGCESSGPPAATFVRKIDWIGRGEWVKADTHIHTKFSDGANTVSEVAFQARQHGCDVIAITDHADSNLQAATPEYADAIRAARREHPDLIILAGLEWNVPPFAGDEHATLLVPGEAREFDTLAGFKQRFDDLDREPHDDQLAIDALKWLDQLKTSPGISPLIIYNHPNRKTATATETALRIETWRSTNDIVIGLSGAPGHQRGQQLGAYGEAVQLIDRWDPAVAEVGGAWDQLLAKEIDVWGARAPSDFHSAQSANVADYWPGEFSETWLYVPEKTGEGVLDAFRAGSFFAAHGHIAREVELTVNAAGLDRPAHVGEAIEVAADTDITVRLTAAVPNVDWEDQPNQLDVVELIVLEGDKTRIVELKPNIAGELSVEEGIKVRDEGLVVRARGRRKIADGPDLLFYTSPVRVAVIGANSESISKTRTSSETSGQWPISLRFVLATVIAVLLLASIVSVSIPHWATKRTTEDITESEAVGVSAAPRRVHYLAAASGFTLFAIYGSLVPLTFRALDFDLAVEQFQQIPFLKLSIAHRADWVANILLFIPISFSWLGTILVDGPKRIRNFIWALPVILACCCLSVAIEFSQVWFPPRTVSQNDIVAESLGGLIGSLLWFAIGQRATDWIRGYTGPTRSSTHFDWLLQAYLVGLIIYSLIPFDITIHVAEIHQKLQAGKIVLVPFRESDIGLNGMWERFADIMICVPVGFFARRLCASSSTGSNSPGRAILLGTGIVAAIEVSQVFVYTRYAETEDVIIGALGIAGGVWLAGQWYISADDSSANTARSGLVHTLTWIATTLTYTGVICLVFWWPLDFTSDATVVAMRLHGFFRVPLESLYWGTEFNAATQFLRKTLYFLPLGILSAHLALICPTGRSPRWILLFAAGFFCIAVATGVELVQAMLPSHVCDITDSMLYSLGAISGLVIRSRMSSESDCAINVSIPETDNSQSAATTNLIVRHSPDLANAVPKPGPRSIAK